MRFRVGESGGGAPQRHVEAVLRVKKRVGDFGDVDAYAGVNPRTGIVVVVVVVVVVVGVVVAVP